MKKLLDCIKKELSPKYKNFETCCPRRSSKSTGKDLVEIEVLSNEKHKYEISNCLTFMSWCRENVCMYVRTYVHLYIHMYVCRHSKVLEHTAGCMPFCETDSPALF